MSQTTIMERAIEIVRAMLPKFKTQDAANELSRTLPLSAFTEPAARSLFCSLAIREAGRRMREDGRRLVLSPETITQDGKPTRFYQARLDLGEIQLRSVATQDRSRCESYAKSYNGYVMDMRDRFGTFDMPLIEVVEVDESEVQD